MIPGGFRTKLRRSLCSVLRGQDQYIRGFESAVTTLARHQKAALHPIAVVSTRTNTPSKFVVATALMIAQRVKVLHGTAEET